MNPVQIIAKKRDGSRLDAEEIAGFVRGYAEDSIPDYQMAALAMAICLRGMTADETAALTREMLHSGVTLDWPTDAASRVDKHSTGGIGDKVSLVLAPLLACCDLLVPMISGRGLGATGGTLDKLESISGFRTDLTTAEIGRITQQVGCVITGATADLAPADKKLYALRDVTATVESIPLITASIMSKKLAEGLDALVLDVKFGSGAFMKTREDARALAESLVAVGQAMNVATTALLSDMNQPLGRMVGNAVEVNESLDALAGGGPADLRELVVALGAELLVRSGRAATAEAAAAQLNSHLDPGAALDKFREMVTAQGGDLDAPRPVAPAREITAERSGFVAAVDTQALGHAIIEMGGGRRVMTDAIDRSVGLEMLVRIGDAVDRGQPLIRVFAPAEAYAQVTQILSGAITMTDQPTEGLPLILDRLA